MKLYEAIKQIISQFGEQTVVESRLVNLLSDFLAFEDYPSEQQIIKDFVARGYSAQLLDVCRSFSGNEQMLRIDQLKSNFAQSKKYKNDLASFAVDCFLFGLGLVDKVNEPYSNGFSPFENDSSNILDSLGQQLAELKKKFEDYLDKLIVLPKDIIHDAAGYYTAESQNVLYSIELKIRIISEDLGLSDSSWCQSQKKSRLDSYKKKKTDAINNAINKKKKEYEQQIDALVAQYTKYLKEHEELPTNDGSSTLHFIADEINALYKELHVDFSSDRYWQDSSEGFEQRKTKAREQLLNKYKGDYKDKFDGIIREYRDFIKKRKQLPTSDGYAKLQPLEAKLRGLSSILGVLLPDDFFEDILKKFAEEKEKAINPLIKDLEDSYTDEINDVISQYKNALFANNEIPSVYGQDKLKFIEDRINAVYEKAGIAHPTNSFVKSSLASLEVQKKNAIVQLIDKLKKQYLNVLQEGITIPSNFYLKRSGYFDRKTSALIDQRIAKITELYNAAGLSYDGFCEAERESILAKHAIDKSVLQKQFWAKIVAPGIVTLFLAFMGGNYAVSADEIGKFDEGMAKANTLFKNGDYTGAITSYMLTRDSYDGSFMPTKYEGEANDKIKEIIPVIKSKCQDLINGKKLIEAKNLVDGIPAKLLQEDNAISATVTEINENINSAVNNGVNDIISAISRNGGKLGEEDKQYLEQLLQLSPDDYWLNFVKNKEK